MSIHEAMQAKEGKRIEMAKDEDKERLRNKHTQK